MKKEELIDKIKANNRLLNAVVQEMYLDNSLDIRTRDYYASNVTSVRKNSDQIIEMLSKEGID